MIPIPLWNRRRFLKTAISGVVGIAMPQVTSPRITATSLTNNLFMLTGAGTNVLAMTAADGAVMVDGGLPEHADALVQAVSALPGGGRVRTLFNTCWFPEQTGSNQTLGKAGATIIAHENTRLWLTTDITRPWEKRTFQRTGKRHRNASQGQQRRDARRGVQRPGTDPCRSSGAARDVSHDLDAPARADTQGLQPGRGSGGRAHQGIQ
jgi:glyoxylase-like metal-dependent hydrolase (beta-lactamase superfamily II)